MQAATRRDPDGPKRLALALTSLVLLWPLLVWTEFKPWEIGRAHV